MISTMNDNLKKDSLLILILSFVILAQSCVKDLKPAEPIKQDAKMTNPEKNSTRLQEIEDQSISGERSPSVLSLGNESQSTAKTSEELASGSGTSKFERCQDIEAEIKSSANDSGYEITRRTDKSGQLFLLIYTVSANKQSIIFKGSVAFLKDNGGTFQQKCETDGKFFNISKI
jgi:hypothetical protein